MLAIRMQRTGRKGHAQFRVIVQDSRFSPTSGRVVAYLGSYNPHTKSATLDKDKAQSFLDNGAQPSDRVVSLLKIEGIKLPAWVKEPSKHERTIRNPEKMRRNRPAEEASANTAEAEETPAGAESAADLAEPEAAEADAPAEQLEQVAAGTDEPAAATETEAAAAAEVDAPPANAEAEPTESEA